MWIRSLLAIVPLALPLAVCSTAYSHDEHTSQWKYIDERWPTHAGPLIDLGDPDGYLKQILIKESVKIQSWYGKDGVLAMDSVNVCGVRFTGYIRQRPKGTYLLVVISSVDERNHRLKWIPMEYRFDNESPQELFRRVGSPDLKEGSQHFYEGGQQQENLRKRHDSPNIRTEPEIKNVYKDEFRKRERSHLLPRGAGYQELKAPFRVLEAFKFPDPKQLTGHEHLQVYMPWVDDCEQKPVLLFHRTQEKEIVWDAHLRAWTSTGMQAMVPFHTNGWSVIRPTPSLYFRFAHPIWNHHSFSVEIHAAFVQNAAEKAVLGALTRLSYGYAIWLGKYFTLMPEFGYRGILGVLGLTLSGYGGGLDLAFEVPGTRHQQTGQRLVLEAGCDFEKHHRGITIAGNDMNGAWGNCKIGFGLGW